MLSEELRSCLKPVLIIEKIIWFTLTLSIPLYVAVAYGVGMGGGAGTLEAPPWLTAAFAAAALGAGGFSVIYRRRAFSEERLRSRLGDLPLPPGTHGEEEAGTQIPPAVAARLRAYRALAPPERRLLALAARLLVPQVVCLAANEAVVAFGFALSVILGWAAAVIPFALAALGLNLAMYPRTEEVLARMRGWAETA